MEFNHKPKVENKNYIVLKDGEKVTGVFAGKPYAYYVRWDKGKSEVVGENEPGAKFRAKFNFIVQENGAYVAKMWNASATIYNRLADLNENNPLENSLMTIKRIGSGTDTDYNIDRTATLTNDQKEKIRHVKLHDLEEKLTKNNNVPEPPQDLWEQSAADEVPF